MRLHLVKESRFRSPMRLAASTCNVRVPTSEAEARVGGPSPTDTRPPNVPSATTSGSIATHGQVCRTGGLSSEGGLDQGWSRSFIEKLDAR